MNLAGVFDDLRAALVAELLLDILQLLHDDAAQLLVRSQDFEVFGDLDLDIGQFLEDLLDLHSGQALQLQFDDGLRLPLGESLISNRFRLRIGGRIEGHQAVARFPWRLGVADQLDHGIQIVERALEAEQKVLALARLAQQVVGAAANHIDAMIDEAPEHVGQTQLARLTADDGQHDDAEIDLELRVLVQVVQNDFGLLAALQFEDDAHAVAIALVANFRDAFDLLLVYQPGRSFDQARLVHLVRNLGDDDRFPVLAESFGGRFGAQLQRAAALGEVIQDALAAENEPAGRKIRALHQVHDFAQMRVRLLDQQNGRVDDLGQIVRRDVGGHAHRDAGRSVDQQVRERASAVLRAPACAHRSWAGNRRFPCPDPRAARCRCAKAALRCTGRPRADRHRPNRSCPGHPPADSAARSPAPCEPARRTPSASPCGW